MSEDLGLWRQVFADVLAPIVDRRSHDMFVQRDPLPPAGISPTDWSR
jgi:hypothetical protein